MQWGLVEQNEGQRGQTAAAQATALLLSRPSLLSERQHSSFNPNLIWLQQQQSRLLTGRAGRPASRPAAGCGASAATTLRQSCGRVQADSSNYTCFQTQPSWMEGLQMQSWQSLPAYLLYNSKPVLHLVHQ